MQLPERSTVAAGLGGLFAWGASLGLASLGYPVPQSTLLPLTVALMTAICHWVPDAAKVDAEIKTIGAELPTTYAEYPGSPPVPTPSNINQG
jgi:hypothetical protein